MASALLNGLEIVLSFALMMIALLFALNWLMRGMLFSFMKVRASRGKKTMVDVHGVNEVYYRVGEFNGTRFEYKNRKGELCTYANIPAVAVHNTMGIQKVEIDEVNSCLWTREGAIIQGNDPVAVDNLIKRAIESPEVRSTIYKVLIALVVLLLLISIGEVIMTFKVLSTLGKTTLAHVIP